MKIKNLFQPLVATSLAMLFSASANADLIATSTFTDSSGGTNASRAVSNVSSGFFTDTLTATYAHTTSGTPSPLFRTGTNNTAANFNPNQNVDNAAGAFWQADFDYNGGTSSFNLDSLDFRIYRFNSAGNVQVTDTNVRTVNFTASYTLDGGANWIQVGSTQNVNTTASIIGNQFIDLNFATSSTLVNLSSNDFRIRFRAANDASNVGAFIGLNRIQINATAVPEPNSAVLFASIACLAGLKRRRR